MTFFFLLHSFTDRRFVLTADLSNLSIYFFLSLLSRELSPFRLKEALYSFFLAYPKTFFFLIYLFLAALGLRCCTRAFSSCGERGLLFVAVRGLLIAVASLVAEHGL